MGFIFIYVRVFRYVLDDKSEPEFGADDPSDAPQDEADHLAADDERNRNSLLALAKYRKSLAVAEAVAAGDGLAFD